MMENDHPAAVSMSVVPAQDRLASIVHVKQPRHLKRVTILMMTADRYLPIFVYGTLKRGQCRESSWPYAPLEVVAATTPGRLYDFGAYPGLAAGPWPVAGELWFVEQPHFEPTLRVLDSIESFQCHDDDLYERRIVQCISHPSRHKIQAYAYFYKHPPANSVAEVRPNEAGQVNWCQPKNP